MASIYELTDEELARGQILVGLENAGSISCSSRVDEALVLDDELLAVDDRLTQARLLDVSLNFVADDFAKRVGELLGNPEVEGIFNVLPFLPRKFSYNLIKQSVLYDSKTQIF